MAAANNNNEQLSGRVDESLQDTSPPAIAPLKGEKEPEELRRLAQLRLQKARADLAAGNITGTAGSTAANDTDVSELEAVSPKTSPESEHGPVHFIAELAAVADHQDIDHEMPDAPDPEDDAQEDVEIPIGPEDEDIEMPDAPVIDPDDAQDDVEMPNAPAEDEDTEMPDAPPLPSDDTSVQSDQGSSSP